MKTLFLSISVCLLLASFTTADKKIKLFNGKNFDGWYTFLEKNGKNNDPDKVFTIENGTIHITGKEFGYMATNASYENYRLVLEFK